MKSHRVAVILALAGACALMSGCGGPPQPVASTPLFSSEDEAFAAAEETYRNYVDALNQVDLSDPETFEAVYSWTTGEFNADERKTLSQMHADGWAVSGETMVLGFAGTSTSLGHPAVTATVCTDISSVAVTDQAGNSVVAQDRPGTYTLEVSFVADTVSRTLLKISASNALEGPPCE